MSLVVTVCGRHCCHHHGHCLWPSWFVAVTVKPPTQQLEDASHQNMSRVRGSYQLIADWFKLYNTIYTWQIFSTMKYTSSLRELIIHNFTRYTV